MKRIKLNGNHFIDKYTLVDDRDYKYLNQFKWYLSNVGYAYKNIVSYDVKEKENYLHRIITRTPKNMQTDHINRDKLDNRRCNLRIVNKSFNMFNRGKQSNNTSGYKGVWLDKTREQWVVEAKIGGKKYHLGRYNNIKDAFRVRSEFDKIILEAV